MPPDLRSAGRDDRQNDVRGILLAVIYLLPGSHGPCFQAEVVRPGIQVAEVVREVTAGDLDANAVPLAEDIGRRSPEANRVLQDSIGRDVTQFLGVEGPFFFRIAVA